MSKDAYLDPPQEDFPPSYSEATSSSTPTHGPPSSYTSHISAHLASLPSAIRTNHDSHLAHQATFDADLLSLITPEIDSLLLLLSSPPPSHRTPPQNAALILVPSAAVPPSAKYAHDDSPEELVRVARISDPKGIISSTSSKSEKRAPSAWDAFDSREGESSTTREFSDWGRWEDDSDDAAALAGPQWWWRDEDMASRLAAHLQPKPQVRVDRRSVRQAVETQREERRGQRVLERLRSGNSSRAASGAADGSAGMTVVAEEVTFRRENEMGIWEKLSGWGIVARVDLRGT